jgi:hypothetical protein
MGRPLTKLEEELTAALGQSYDREAKLQNRLTAIKTERDWLKKAILSHLDAPIWGHNHWDDTQRHGAGCKTCIAQRDARQLLRSALGKED